ncbi:MAG: helix-turn-helix domain-containing protein [Pirellulales bacterium]
MIESIAIDTPTYEPPRDNYFALYWIESGRGDYWSDATKDRFESDRLLCFTPYRLRKFACSGPLRATVVRFHANFLCVETFHAETGCSGALFKDEFGPPSVAFAGTAKKDALGLIARLRREANSIELGAQEALLATLKLLLIAATRLKTAAVEVSAKTDSAYRHPTIVRLRELIEADYRRSHTPAQYAKMLHMTAKALGRCVSEHLGKTPRDLIRERILTHAKWHLLHTLRPVKELAAELGFRDELYFSRFFKKSTGLSPVHYREFETRIRGGSNLSMTSDRPSISHRRSSPDTSG